MVAIVAVWFFVLRGGGGDEFVGTWNAVRSDEGSLVIEHGDDGIQVTMVGADKQRVGPLKTDLNGDALEIKLEAVGDDAQQKAAVEMVRALFEATIEDFKMTLRVRGAASRRWAATRPACRSPSSSGRAPRRSELRAAASFDAPSAAGVVE
jgi:hypothetical protein